MKLSVHPDATADVDAIAYQFGGSDEQVGLRFVDAVIAAYSTIAENPRLGQLAKTLNNKAEVRRAIPWPFRNHQIIYVVTNDEAIVARVVHSASNFEAMFNAGFLEGLSEGAV